MDRFILSIPGISEAERKSLLEGQRIPGRIGYHAGLCLSRKAINQLLRITKTEARECQLETLGPDTQTCRQRADRSNKHRIRHLAKRGQPNSNRILFVAKNLVQAGDSPCKRALKAKKREMTIQSKILNGEKHAIQSFVTDSKLNLVSRARQQAEFQFRLKDEMTRISRQHDKPAADLRPIDPLLGQALILASESLTEPIFL